MSTVTAEPDMLRAAVVLTITAETPVLSIIRADANGTRPVRLHPGTLPASGTFTITDYEPALAGLIQYRVDDGGLGADTWTAVSAKLPRFILPSVPLYSVVVETVTDYSAGRESRSTMHEPIGRDDPVFALGKLKTRRGQLNIYCGEYQAARDLETIFERGQVVMYREADHPGLDMYFVARALNTTPSDGRWITAVDYVEVTAPAGDIQSRPDWTFDAVAAAHPSFDDVSVSYDNFNQLTIGEESIS